MNSSPRISDVLKEIWRRILIVERGSLIVLEGDEEGLFVSVVVEIVVEVFVSPVVLGSALVVEML